MTLDENDYLTFQLYLASKTPRIKRARIRGWILTTVTFLCFAYLFYRSDEFYLVVYFLVMAGLSIVFYPFYSRWRYRRHYLNYVKDTYKDRFGRECSLDITDTEILMKDKTGDGRVNTTEIEEINEIKDFYFIKVSGGTCLIVSKIKSDNPTAVKNAIESLITSRGIKHNVELDWQWK